MFKPDRNPLYVHWVGGMGMSSQSRGSLAAEGANASGVRASLRPPRNGAARTPWERLRLICSALFRLLNIGRMPSELVSARDHSLLLTHHRMLFMSDRLGMTAFFLGVATIAWIPIDVVLFHADWALVIPLMIARLIAGVSFLAIAGGDRRSVVRDDVIGSLGLIVTIGIAFFLYVHGVLSAAQESDLAGMGYAQYVLMPIALVAGISIFPLTLKEAGLLTAVPLAAIIFEIFLGDSAAILPQAGAAALLMCAIAITAIVCSVSQLNLLVNLHRESTIDPLTGVLSRRAGAELLTLMFAECQQRAMPFSLAFLDLDHFKAVNDRCGHEAGDQVLRQTATQLGSSKSQRNSLVRWGGEEFVLAFPDVEADSASDLIRELAQSLGERPDGTLQTVSVGLAECRRDGAQNWQELMEIADARMYLAKAGGRDRLLGPDAVLRPLVGDT